MTRNFSLQRFVQTATSADVTYLLPAGCEVCRYALQPHNLYVSVIVSYVTYYGNRAGDNPFFFLIQSVVFETTGIAT